MFKRTKLCMTLLAFYLPFLLLAQDQTPVDNALRLVEQKAPHWGLEASDIDQMLVSDMYKTRHNGVTHIFFQQSIDNIPVYNAIVGVHIDRNGVAREVGHRFIPALRSKVTSSQAVISPAVALENAADHLGINDAAIIPLNDQVEGRAETVYAGSNISHTDIEVEKMYVLDGNEVRLAYQMAIDDLRNDDYWSIRVDAANGEILDQNNYTTYCQFDHAHSGECGEQVNLLREGFQPVGSAVTAAASGTYRVFELPAESPNHGPHVLVTNPHIPEASINGWHDDTGDGNPDYTITRGNNVHAYPDLNDADMSTGGEPDGGAALLFDFPYSDTLEPIDQLDAAVVNLFYTSNMMHDITYLFGFDEAAGNFQQNNFGNGGAGNDYVRSEAQDGSGTNNANFATPPDGASGRMQMYIWNSGGEVFQILAPPAAAGGYETGEAEFGPNIAFDNVDIEGEIVEAFDDNPDNPSYCCDPIINGSEIEGKIALIDRGGCFFDYKVRNAEDNGAIAVVICNFAPSPIGMAASGTVTEPTIPVVMLGSDDCAKIRTFIGGGLIGKFKAPEGDLVALDGDFDNGIIAHEYGHGISNRLTGGPSLAGCLGNAEQMGEGWSDYFTLITTVNEGDVGETPRGIGTYAQRQPVDGGGIRPRPYTTDFSVNELTYDHIKDAAQISQPHGIGTVWCTMLWDLYWAFVDEYGWDADYSNMTAGNNIAIQLVMDGMKLQVCNPGFVDGRDAILMADTINNDGVNGCMIWEVFARRGLGYYAEQGSSNDRFDGVENFEVAPLCQNSLRINKDAPTSIKAGEEIEYTISVENNKPTATTGVVVTDIIPEFCEYIDGSASHQPTFNGEQIIFDLADMASLQSEVITYKVRSADNRASQSIWLDDMESGEDNWDLDLREGFTIWYQQDQFANSGEVAFYTENGDMDSDQLLYQFDPITLDVENPGMRFFHDFSTSTETNIDGGTIQMSKDGVSWQFIGSDQMLRNGYNTALAYGTFTIPNLDGFAGTSGGFIDTYIDLAEFKDEDVQVRFRFGTEEGGNEDNNLALPAGWVVDDVEYLNLFFYKTEVCVTSDDGDVECDELPGKGTLVEPQIGVSSEDLPEEILKAFVYPSPATDEIRMRMKAKAPQEAQIFIVSEDGRQLKNMEVGLYEGIQVISVEISDLPTGTYFFNVQMESGQFTRSFIKN